jgi:hypothetical protein
VARANGAKDPDLVWAAVGHPVRDRYEDSLVRASTFARPLVEGLYAARADPVATITAQLTAEGHTPGGPDWNHALTGRLRRLRTDTHLVDAVTWQRVSDAEVDRYVGILQAFSSTLARLRAHPVTAPAVAPDAGRSLGLRRPGTLRVLYETSPSGDHLPVLGDSPVSVGGTAAQYAGPAITPAGTLFGGAVGTELDHAGQLGSATAAARAAATGDPLLVPLSPGAPPVGAQVFAILYTVLPAADDAAVQKVYEQALAAVSDWNATKTGTYAIANVRLVLPDPTKAGPVLAAAVAAAKADPALAALTLLVGTSDLQGGTERKAFDAAAAARGLTVTGEGFDLPIA